MSVEATKKIKTKTVHRKNKSVEQDFPEQEF